MKNNLEGIKLPIFVKYGLIALLILAVIAIGIVIYINAAEGYVAKVDGQKIKKGEFLYFLEVQKLSMYSSALEVDPQITEETFWATKINNEDAIEVAKQKAIDSVKNLMVQMAKAKEAGITLSKEELASLDADIQATVIDTMDPQNNGEAGKGNKLRANKEMLKKYGFEISDLREALIKKYTVQKYQLDEINKIPDSEADIETYYKSNPEWYAEDLDYRRGGEEAVWARHILILAQEDVATEEEKAEARKKAEEVIEKLNAGADFVELVKEYSEDPGSNTRGGDYVFGRGRMYPEFEDAAFALTPGTYTLTPVETTSGYHIIKTEEKYEQDEPVSLECAKSYFEFGGNMFIKYKLYMNRAADMAKNAKVEINNSVYNSIK